ncbi:DegT/DnrJ/EryC1/StrS aminotransferase family protein [Sphingomonas sp.]|uniref:DegT/DnrJ/EryC1/StrS family aminotransferase n=1 Tax=Sphingomonas sp. TaxID=28214 RepID=UPI001809C8E7|nr:DegT/DnrJ/EryC1/StrS aminotransferase family protein [Sphingomonas sp.]MBA3511190.1 DegT/DnrJ/EryC1/StrS aminotransferase family protein [Sphingomonas sp.]
MLNTSVAPWPSYSEEERQAVARVLESGRVNYWTGEETRQFEREFAEWAGAARAVAVFNGTVALDLALQALGIGQGDEVIVTPRTFIASVSCVMNAGATPVFADVDPDSGNISPATVEQLITERTRAILPVHLGGWPCEMGLFRALADERGLLIIEDCAQAHGATVDGRMVGTFGEIGAWSFCQDKIMTTGGEGGMVTTDDEELWSSMWSYKDHGKSWEAVYKREHPPGYRWLHESVGTNWRMIEAQAALGRIQLRRMTDWTARRTANARAYIEVLGRFSSAVRVPEPRDGLTHAYYRLYAYVRPDGLRSGWSRDRIVAELNALDVPAFHGGCSEVYLEKAFDGTGLRPPGRLPVARELGETSIAFLTHPTLTNEDLERTAAAIGAVFADAAA